MKFITLCGLAVRDDSSAKGRMADQLAPAFEAEAAPCLNPRVHALAEGLRSADLPTSVTALKRFVGRRSQRQGFA
jgi:hypothetical protein